MKARLLQIANFLRLLDEDGLASLSNIAVIVVLIKMAFSTSISLTEAAALLTVLGAYNFRHWTRARGKDVSTANAKAFAEAYQALAERVATAETELSKVKLLQGLSSDGLGLPQDS